MKKGFAILTLFLVLLTVGCGQDKLQNGKTTIAQINETKEVRIGVDPTIPLYSFVDKNGHLSGYDIDIMEEAAKRLGLHTKYYYANSDSLIAGLNSKRFDVTTGHIVITNDKNKFDFSIPYKQTTTVIIQKKGQDEKINLSNLKGLGISLPITSVYASIANKYNMFVMQGDTFVNGILDVEKGKTKYMLFDKEVIDSVLAENKIDDIEVGYTFPQQQSIGLMYRKGNDSLVQTFNKKLEEMKNDGTMKKLEDKWFQGKND
ncbi:substrate-binding periplasmic protein [Ectobacillus sp. sgz5001026]|uniref:substrate-binding periplasmic protein n=1 Tax=Ectobacillus sp. sgz5001026 TaxID=3242473 RepID=UPI0036D4184B